MKQKQGIVTEKFGEGLMLVPTEGSDALSVVSLNESAAFVWSLLETEHSFSELAEAVIQRYEIPRELAEQDLTALLDSIKGFLE